MSAFLVVAVVALSFALFSLRAVRLAQAPRIVYRGREDCQ